MATKTKKSDREQMARQELISRGYQNVKKEDRFGETNAGWWADDVYLGKSAVDALRIADGGS